MREAAAGPPPRFAVRDLMRTDVPVLEEHLPLRSAALVLVERGIGGVPVVDADGALVGVLSDSDLLAREASPRERRGPTAREERRQRRAMTVGQACSRPAITVHPDTSVREAARLMLDEDVSRLVVSDRRLTGVITRLDVLRALLRPPEDLRHAAEAELVRARIEGVAVAVDDGGVAVVSGRVPRRSQAEEARRLVAAVDGVIDVEGRIDADLDDLGDREGQRAG